ncbi:MAG TPA: class I SAM-dependent methyltransferase [Gemmatales bacterium]|nr:class I SAM-dependent methyltransferase [Gemmatales bacterium]
MFEWYRRLVFPLLCDLALDVPEVTRLRRSVLAGVEGEVLEIGFGTGLNAPCYPPTVRAITTVDPNVGMSRRARLRARSAGLDVRLHPLSGEKLPFPAGHFDCVVSTFTLCSIPNVGQALSEVRRVLRPGGRIVFLEHGICPDPGVRKWQQRLNGLEMRFLDGCHLDRDIRALVSAEPFASVEMAEFCLKGAPKTHGWLYQGVAVK